jgi:hypothetical protein
MKNVEHHKDVQRARAGAAPVEWAWYTTSSVMQKMEFDSTTRFPALADCEMECYGISQITHIRESLRTSF